MGGLLAGKDGGTSSDNQVFLSLKKLQDEDVVSQATTQILAWLFLVSILVHLLIESMNDHNVWWKLCHIYEFFKPPRSSRFANLNPRIYLLLDMFMSCWGCIWCSIDAFLLLAIAETPQDVILDGLAILVLFNIDDFGSELTFKESFPWAPLKLGWIHAHIVVHFLEEKDKEFDDRLVMGEEHEDETPVTEAFAEFEGERVAADFRGACCFKITNLVMVVFLFLLPTLFALQAFGLFSISPLETTFECVAYDTTTTESNQTVRECQEWAQRVVFPYESAYLRWDVADQHRTKFNGCFNTGLEGPGLCF